MSLYFEELDYRPTPTGALSLRRRRELSLGVDVFEIKLGDEYLMSSLFTASEIALARMGLAELPNLDDNIENGVTPIIWTVTGAKVRAPVWGIFCFQSLLLSKMAFINAL